MSDWYDELEFALLPLEDAKIDSDCMTSVISNALRVSSVNYLGRFVLPH